MTATDTQMAALRQKIATLTGQLEAKSQEAYAWWSQLNEAGIKPVEIDPCNGPLINKMQQWTPAPPTLDLVSPELPEVPS